MLAILTTHPIQYQVPLWQCLSKDGRVPFEVWYMTEFAVRPSRDREFGWTFAWNIATLSGYPYRFLEAAPGATPASFWQCRLREHLRDRLRLTGARAVWIQGWQVAAYWQAVRDACTAGIEVWLRGESNDLATCSFLKRMAKRGLLNWLFSNVDRFFYIGSANRRLYLEYGVPHNKLYSAPYAVDNNRFRTQADVLRPFRTEIRRQWGVPDDAFCVLFCGKLIKKKRPLDLVAAARMLAADGSQKPIHLLFAGSGELSEELRRECHVVFDTEHGFQSGEPGTRSRPPASFTGFLNQTEISRAYVAADCLVLASDHRETWGLVVNEALASGLPCVVSDACGCAEDLVHRTNTFRCGDIRDLTSRLATIPPAATVQPNLPSFNDTVRSIVRAYETLDSPAVSDPRATTCTGRGTLL